MLFLTIGSLKQRWRLLTIFALAVLIGPYLYSRLASPTRCVSLHTTGNAPVLAPSTSGSLRVACYNIAHGRGLAVSNWQGGTPKERMNRLNEIAGVLKKIDADIVVLNEVDFDCSWSHSVNQARRLAEEAGYPHWVEQRNLDFRLLFLTWRFGNAVLSKHPITAAEVVDLPGFSSWETLLAGKKKAVRCDILVGDSKLQLIGAHLSHRSEEVRVKSAKRITSLALKSGRPTVVAGDMNSTPPAFPEFSTDPAGNNAIEVLDRSKRLQRFQLDADNRDQFTFPSNDPRCVIDWVLIPMDWHFEEYRVESTELSDHLPVYTDIAPIAE